MTEVEARIVALHIVHKRRHIVGHTEEDCTGVVELHLDVLQALLPQPVVRRQVHRLLWRSGALYRHRRLCEQGPPALELLYQLPGVGGQVKAIVGGDSVAPQAFCQPRNRVPVELDARSHHQPAIAYDATPFQHHRVVSRVEGRHCRLDPVSPARNQRRHGARCGRRLENPCPHKGPTGLVVMNVRRVDDGNRQRLVAAQQTGGAGNTPCPRPHNHHVIFGEHQAAVPLAITGHPGHHATHVITGFSTPPHDVGRRKPAARPRQGPQRRGAHAGAAVSVHPTLYRVEQLTELACLGIGHLARRHGQVVCLYPRHLRGALHLGIGRLVSTLAIRAVADDVLHAACRQVGEFIGRYLRRHAQLFVQCTNIHGAFLEYSDQSALMGSFR